MPTEVLAQLRALRESIADALRKDPRYLTLAALDKSIAEISGVLKASGVAETHAAPPEPLQFSAPPPASGATGSPSFTASPAPPSLSEPAAVAPASAAAPLETPGADHEKPVITPVDAAGPADVVAEEVRSIVSAESVQTTTVPETAETDAGENSGDNGPPAATTYTSVFDPLETNEKVLEIGSSAVEHEAEAFLPEEAANHETTGEPTMAQASTLEASTLEDPVLEDPALEDPTAEDDAPADVTPMSKASGYITMLPRVGATQYQPAMSVKFGKLPNKVDLRPLMTPIEDQGNTSSCVANAVAGAYEYWIKKASKQDHTISRLFVYYNARWRDGSQEHDGGSAIQLAMDGLAKFGACSDKVWPFDSQLVLKKPGADAYRDAAPYKIHDLALVPLKVESWKQALAEGKPIVFGCELFESIDECAAHGGVVLMPTPDDIVHASHQTHAMCAVGYSESEKVFIVRNCWGTDFGDQGYCYMPFAYLMSPKLNDGDCWVFIPKVPSQPPREVWSDDTKPVTNGGNGVDFPIEPYNVSDYDNVGVDLFEGTRRPFNAAAPEDFSSYVSLAGKGMWSDMEPFDVSTFLTTKVELVGVAAVAAELTGSGDVFQLESASAATHDTANDKADAFGNDEG